MKPENKNVGEKCGKNKPLMNYRYKLGKCLYFINIMGR
jgi:hypothetical protein